MFEIASVHRETTIGPCFLAAPLAAAALSLSPAALLAEEPAAHACETVEDGETRFAVCRFHPERHDIRLFLNDASGAPYGHFFWLEQALAAGNETLLFAMNAGMYHKDRSPVGLYIENGRALAALNGNDGPGNFHLKPNGVFWIRHKDGERTAGVSAVAGSTLNAPDAIEYATQSGPMLVIDGAIHPRFLPDSDSLKRRNGVGVTESGEVVFVLADTPVRFYDFALFFRDVLETPNALYLDGAISRLWSPELERNDPGAQMGPIVGVVAPLE